MKVRYDGPANPAYFGPAVGKDEKDPKYTFVPGGVYTLNKEEADAILNPVNHYVDHKFVVVTGDEPPPVVVPTSVKEV